MGSGVWLPAMAALSLALLGCDNSADHAAPDDGTCWTVPADDAVDPDYWFDDSSKVSCTEPHTTETVSVLRLTNPTIAEAKEMAGRCRDEVSVCISVSTPTIGFTGGSGGSCRAGRRLPTAPPGCAATRSSPRGTTAAFGPPPARLLVLPWTHPRTCGRASMNTPTSPSSRSSPATSRTGTSRPGRWRPWTILTSTPAELEATAQRQCAYAVPEAGRRRFHRSLGPPIGAEGRNQNRRRVLHVRQGRPTAFAAEIEPHGSPVGEHPVMPQ